jgi:hypothetical protein
MIGSSFDSTKTPLQGSRAPTQVNSSSPTSSAIGFGTTNAFEVSWLAFQSRSQSEL